MTKSVDAVDVIVQQLGHDTVSRLQQGPVRLYSDVRVPCPEDVTCVSGASATSIRWKVVRSVDEGGWEQAKGRSTETWQDSAIVTRFRGSANSRSSRC